MGASDLADEIVRKQVEMYDAEIKTLDTQVEALRARKSAVQRMKDAIVPLLSSRAPTPSVPQKNGAGPQAPIELSRQNKTITVSPPTGFRDAIRSILKAHPRGLKPAEVLKELVSRGDLARYSGRSPATRVHNELYLLRKRGALSRRSGRYSLVMEGSDATTNT